MNKESIFGRGKDFPHFKELSNSTVVLCGAGGIGSSIILDLLKSGISKFVLIDEDIIEEQNIGTGFFPTASISSFKVAVCERMLRYFDADVTVTTRKEFVTPTFHIDYDNLVNGTLVFLCCADNDEARRDFFNHYVGYENIRMNTINNNREQAEIYLSQLDELEVSREDMEQANIGNTIETLTESLEDMDSADERAKIYNKIERLNQLEACYIYIETHDFESIYIDGRVTGFKGDVFHGSVRNSKQYLASLSFTKAEAVCTMQQTMPSTKTVTGDMLLLLATIFTNRGMEKEFQFAIPFRISRNYLLTETYPIIYDNEWTEDVTAESSIVVEEAS